MRLPIKIFLACSLVVVVLAGVAVWSLVELAHLASAERTVTVQTAEALRLQVLIREAVVEASHLEMRNLVFGDREYAAVSSARAARIASVLVALAGTAAIAVRLMRSLRRLSEAAKAVAEGAFHEPLSIESKDEVGELAQSFNRMAVRLREIDHLKEQFYSTVSHELRSPLNAMRESARLIEERAAGPLTAKQERLISIMHRSTERLLRLVNEVLDLSRASAGLLPLDRGWFDAAVVIARTLDELRPQAEQRGIALRFENGTGAPRVFGDQDRIVQMVVNLVANALRFTPSGCSVTVRVHATDTDVQVLVEDTGAGIRAELLPHVFERFRQAHSGRGGAGLGLAIVRAMAEAQGGRVTVESEEGRGSRFTITLPQGAQTPAPVAAPTR